MSIAHSANENISPDKLDEFPKRLSNSFSEITKVRNINVKQDDLKPAVIKRPGTARQTMTTKAPPTLATPTMKPYKTKKPEPSGSQTHRVRPIPKLANLPEKRPQKPLAKKVYHGVVSLSETTEISSLQQTPVQSLSLQQFAKQDLSFKPIDSITSSKYQDTPRLASIQKSTTKQNPDP
jgi:hypothetical protein